MSHHYGETLVKAEVFRNTFFVEMASHQNKATVTLTGPLQGVYESDPQKSVSLQDAERLGREVAHVLANFFR
jgi:hypothetical protein